MLEQERLDSTVKRARVRQGALVGLGVGLVFSVIKVRQANRACERTGCDGPFIQPVVYPIVYGISGSAIGAVTMWLWSKR